MRTFGIEEEFFVIEPLTGLPCAPPAHARDQLLALSVGGTKTVGEFLTCQLESNSPICIYGDEAISEVRTYRAALAQATRNLGYQVGHLALPR